MFLFGDICLTNVLLSLNQCNLLKFLTENSQGNSHTISLVISAINLKANKRKKANIEKKTQQIIAANFNYLLIYWFIDLLNICQNELLSPTQKYLGTPSRKKTWHWLSKSLPDAWLSVLLSQKFTKVWFVFKIFQVLINIVINYKDCKYLPPLN